MDSTDLKTEAPFVKMSVNVILTGAISKASGGDFYQGAMRALVVWLYNTGENFGQLDPFTGLTKSVVNPFYSSVDKGVHKASKAIDKATTLTPETKKAISKGADNVSTVTGIGASVCAETVLLSELSIPLGATSAGFKWLSIATNDNTVEQNTLSVARDGGIDMIAPTGNYLSIFIIEAFKAYLNSASK